MISICSACWRTFATETELQRVMDALTQAKSIIPTKVFIHVYESVMVCGSLFRGRRDKSKFPDIQMYAKANRQRVLTVCERTSC